MPPLIIVTLFGTQEAGLYALAQRFFGAPLVFIGQAIGQVFLGEGARLLTINAKDFSNLFFTVIIVLTVLSFVLIGPLGFLNSDFLTLFFGSGWGGLTGLVFLLLPMFLFQFIASPLSNTLAILEKQKLMFVIDLFRFFILITLTVFSYLYFTKFSTFLLGLSILNCGYYFVLTIASSLVLRAYVKSGRC